MELRLKLHQDTETALLAAVHHMRGIGPLGMALATPSARTPSRHWHDSHECRSAACILEESQPSSRYE